MNPSIALLLQILGVAAGVMILHHALAAINGMGSGTRHGVRIAFILIAAGGFAQILDPWTSAESAAIGDSLLAIGLALLLVFDARCLNCPRAIAVAASRRRRSERPVDAERT